jgi:hypothetical protein
MSSRAPAARRRRLAVLRRTGIAVRDLDHLLRGQSASESSIAVPDAKSIDLLKPLKLVEGRFKSGTCKHLKLLFETAA